MQKLKSTKLPKLYTKEQELDYIYDYTKDISEDKILQDILVISECLCNLKTDEPSEETVMYCINFLTEKIDEIYDITKTFSFTIRPDRLTSVAKMLDEFTTEEYRLNHLNEAELKISLVLDLLSATYNTFNMYYKYEFESKKIKN